MFPFSFSGGFSCFFIGMIMLAATVFIFITGATFVGTHLLPVFKILSAIGALFSIVVCLPMSFRPTYRFHAGRWLTQLSWVFGLTAWFMSVVAAYEVWGMTAVLLGALLAGVGVIPVGMLAALWTGQTAVFGQILLWTATAFLARSASNRILAHQAEQTRNTFFRTFYVRPEQSSTSFFRTKKTVSAEDDIIDAEYEIIEPPKKEIEPESF